MAPASGYSPIKIARFGLAEVEPPPQPRYYGLFRTHRNSPPYMPTPTDTRGHIIVRGARTHNLKHVDLSHAATIARGHDRRQRIRASRRWLSTRSTPKDSAATSSPCPPTPGSFSSGWKSRTSRASRASARRSPSARRTAFGILAPPSAPRPRSTTTCGCCTPAWVAPSAAPAARR